MDSEKSPSIYVPASPFDEHPPKPKKGCSKTLLSVILSALLIALTVALCMQFWYGRTITETEIDTVRIFEGRPILSSSSKSDAKGNVKPVPWELDFLINPSRLCETLHPPESALYNSNPEIQLLMLVPSSANHFEHRRSIRRTWGSVAAPSGPMRLGFVLGSTTNDTEENMILDESRIHGDIIQADVEDTDRNMTAKSVLMLKWVSMHCAHAQYFLKTDDDTFVNLDMVRKILRKEPYRTPGMFISGFVQESQESSSEEDFLEAYPSHISGSTYLTSGPTAAELFKASQQVQPFLPLDDIFVTGLCADQIDASRIHEPSFSPNNPVRPITWNAFSNLASASSVTPDEIDQLWDEMNKALTSSFNWAGDSGLFNLFQPQAKIIISKWPRLNSEGMSDPESDLIKSVFNLPEVKSIFNMMNDPFGVLNTKPFFGRPTGRSPFQNLFKFAEGKGNQNPLQSIASSDFNVEPIVLRTKITMHMFDDLDHVSDVIPPQIQENPTTFPTTEQSVQPNTNNFKEPGFFGFNPIRNPAFFR